MLENKNKEIKKFTIEQRIIDLYTRMRTLSLFKYSTYLLTGLDISDRAYQTSISTKYGQRLLTITNGNELFYSQHKPVREFHGWRRKHICDVIESDFDTLFSVKVTNGQVEVRTNPMTEFTPEEIDLAILEFEQHIEAEFKKMG